MAAHSPLPKGFTVDHYEIEQVLGRPGAFGITYSAFAQGDARRRVAIKELFPTDCVARDTRTRFVVPQGRGEAVRFRKALALFRNEARLLQRLSHPNVVRIHDYLETHGTGYMVMQFEYGYDLEAHFRAQPVRLNENELLNLLLPLIDGLGAAHHISCLHRDIKPANIYITRDHRPLLLDFGAAREMVSRASVPLATILTPGFAPFEQYTLGQPQGPWTDIYALGAVMHVAMTGRIPPDAMERAQEDRYAPLARRLAGREYSPGFLEAVDRALSFRAGERPQTLDEWKHALAKRAGTPGTVIADFDHSSFAQTSRLIERSRGEKTPGVPPPPSFPTALVLAILASLGFFAGFLAWLLAE